MALTRLQDTDLIAKEVDQLAKELDKLHLAYEQYFLGLEREEPQQKREVVASLIRKYSGTSIQNARLKFKLQQAIARYSSYTTYWNRILREIEEGRYTRDVFRAKIHEKEKAIKPSDTQPQPKLSGTVAAGSLPQDPFTTLFDQYVKAKKKCNESTVGLNLEGFKKSLANQIEALKTKTKGMGVRFQVVTEAGKAKIRVFAQPSNKNSG